VDGAYSVRDLESGTMVQARAENGVLTLQHAFGAQDVWAIAITPEKK
jgi:hypothetical protein